jgi:hypothetical protein
MALSLNELESRGRDINYHLTSNINAADFFLGSCRVMSIIASGAAVDGTIHVKDAATAAEASPDSDILVAVKAADTRVVDFAPLGVKFGTGISIAFTGVGTKAMVTWMEE